MSEGYIFWSHQHIDRIDGIDLRESIGREEKGEGSSEPPTIRCQEEEGELSAKKKDQDGVARVMKARRRK